MSEVKIDIKHLKSPAGIVMTIVVVLGMVGYMHWRRTQLIEQGSAEIEEYLKTELPSRYARGELTAGRGEEIDPEYMEALREVEVRELRPGWLFRRNNKDRVRVEALVHLGTGEERTFHFEFKRQLGSWKLVRETAEPFFKRL